MQLSCVKISNLITFPYVPDLEKDKGIRFATHQKTNVNILIGPNGAGKSSFLEIVNQIIKVGLIKDFVYNKKLVESGDLKGVITEHKMHLHNLQKNFDAEDKLSQVFLTVEITQNDFDNLGFICKFREKVNEIIKKYSGLGVEFPIVDFDKLKENNNIEFKFIVDLDNQIVNLDQKSMTKYQKFILLYLQNHELIQICMNIYNDFEKKEGDRNRYPLKNSFAILGSQRSFADVVGEGMPPMTLSPKRRSMYISGQNTKSYYSVSIGYYLCLMKLWDIMHDIQKSCIQFENKNFEELYSDIFQTELDKSEFFQSLKDMIFKYIGMKLQVEYVNSNFVFVLEGKFGHKYFFDELSSGSQSFLMIILTVFGYDLESGLMIIDEPELHLHPQMQNHFMEFIDEVSRKFDLQIIFATHSPIMINENNIRRVYRFSKKELKTRVENPSFQINADDAELIHMLKFENISKIFFVDKIILVEGETDAYFLSYYIEYLKSLPEWKDKIGDYEVLNIHGKGGLRKWKSFLSKFGIEVFYIGDWDNIVDMRIVSQEDFDFYHQKKKQYYRFLKKHSAEIKKRHYGLLVEMLQKRYPKEYDYIVQQILALYQKDIFLLQNGDLEAYIGIMKKGLEETIYFCHNNFQQWLKNKKFQSKRKEIDKIISKIFGV